MKQFVRKVLNQTSFHFRFLPSQRIGDDFAPRAWQSFLSVLASVLARDHSLLEERPHRPSVACTTSQDINIKTHSASDEEPVPMYE